MFPYAIVTQLHSVLLADIPVSNIKSDTDTKSGEGEIRCELLFIQSILECRIIGGPRLINLWILGTDFEVSNRNKTKYFKLIFMFLYLES